MVTFLMATSRLVGSNSTILSISKNGYRCGRKPSISRMSNVILRLPKSLSTCAVSLVRIIANASPAPGREGYSDAVGEIDQGQVALGSESQLEALLRPCAEESD